MIVLLTLVFVIGLAASNGLAKTAYMEKLKGAKVTLLAVQMPMFSPYWNLAEEFSKKYGIEVEVAIFPFDQMREKTLLDMSSHTGRYDLYMVDVMWLSEYATGKYLEPLKKYIDNPDLTEPEFDIDDFVPRTFNGTGVWDDIIYCVPIGQGTMGQEWRIDYAADAGLTYPTRFDGKWTNDMMLEYAKKMHRPDKGYVGFAPMARRFEWQWNFTQFLYSFVPPDRIGDEFVDKDWKVTINSPWTLEALDWYLQLRDVAAEGSASHGYNEGITAYTTGKSAGGVFYAEWIRNDIEGPNANETRGKSAHLHTPIGPHGRIDPFFGSWGLAISVDSKNKEAAWAFLQWLTAPEQAKRCIAAGSTPVRHSTFTWPETNNYAPWFVELYPFFLKTANPDERIRIPEWAEIADIMGLYGNKTWTNEISPKEALKKMEREIAKALKQGGYYNPNIPNPPQHWRDLSYYDQKPSSFK
jgi:multiple sugar transport system substrate-binding protein